MAKPAPVEKDPPACQPMEQAACSAAAEPDKDWRDWAPPCQDKKLEQVIGGSGEVHHIPQESEVLNKAKLKENIRPIKRLRT